MKTGVAYKGEVSCWVTNSVIKYVESLGHDTNAILKGLPHSRAYLEYPFNCVAYETREEICQRAAELVNDEKLMYQVGLTTPKLNPVSGVSDMVRQLGCPKIAYRSIPQYAGLFDSVVKFRTVIVDGNHAMVIMSLPRGYPPSKHLCYYAQGMLAAIPTLWGLPPAVIRERQCMCQPASEDATSGVEYSAGTCSYQVIWQPLPSWYSRLLAILFKKGNGASATRRRTGGKIPVTIPELEVEGIMAKINGLAHCRTAEDRT